MQQKPLSRLLIPLATASLLWSVSTFAAEEKASTPSYESSVPAAWQSVVSKQSYDEAMTELLAFNRKQPITSSLTMEEIVRAAASPCQQSMLYLVRQYLTDPDVSPALKKVALGLQDLPPAYNAVPSTKKALNPWRSPSSAELLRKMLIFFPKWCTNLPQINGSFDNGLSDIQNVSWLYYHNTAGQDFVQGRNPNKPSEPMQTGEKFTKDFTLQLGVFMDSPASSTYIAQWVNDPTIEIQDYQKKQAGDYKTWNDFFSRELITNTKNQTIPSRPVTMPERDYVVVAPTDCIMNPLVQVLKNEGQPSRKVVDNPLQYNTVLDVKGIPLSMAHLLQGVSPEIQAAFVGGTGQSCVLMPNTYHHFHAPVDGTVVHASIIETNTFGYYDWPNWVPTDGNVGRPGTDFSQFQAYQRGIVIIKVEYNNLGTTSTGYVAVIPVGLESVGSVVLNKEIQKPGAKVKKGYTELGNFFYGGSLNILLYSKGLASDVTQVRMGNQINLFKIGQPIE
ncbi:MAG: phosphatidylserine decarboxylase [Gammaproteobacteria bacterium]